MGFSARTYDVEIVDSNDATHRFLNSNCVDCASCEKFVSVIEDSGKIELGAHIEMVQGWQ